MDYPIPRNGMRTRRVGQRCFSPVEPRVSPVRVDMPSNSGQKERAVARPSFSSPASAGRWAPERVSRRFCLGVRSNGCGSHHHGQRHGGENGLPGNHLDHVIPSTSSLRSIVQPNHTSSTGIHRVLGRRQVSSATKCALRHTCEILRPCRSPASLWYRRYNVRIRLLS